MNKPLIICVDDEKIILDSLKLELSSTFRDLVEIEVAESADEALEIIEEETENGREIPIIISDYVMPGMKGDEFLINCSKTLPKTKRILLTGQATAEGVGNAVINAGLYRFISKPWEKEDLELTISEAFRSFYKDKKIALQESKLEELNRILQVKIAEQTNDLREKNLKIEILLNQTLKGLISSFIRILSKVDSEIFEKSLRIKDLARQISNEIDERLNWEVEVASLICLIGLIDLKEEIKNKYLRGGHLSHHESLEVKNCIKLSVEITNNIPQFESINNGVSNINYGPEQIVNGAVDGSINKISRILRVVIDYDNKLQSGIDKLEVIKQLNKIEKMYDDQIFNKFKDLISVSSDTKVEKETIMIKELKIGMRLAEHIVNKQGKIIIKKFDEIHHENLAIVTRLSRKEELFEPIYILK
ncbi:response regulator [Candidatus Kapabacteria bacterium]|nr:response regulator [Candidatus Kapabacteria bacterium]